MGPAAHIESMTTTEQPTPALSTATAAKQLLSGSGLTANQIGRLMGGLGRAVHHWASGSTPSPRMAGRLLDLHRLVFSLDADTPEGRRAIMLDSSRHPSLFLQFQNETGRPQQIQFPVPVLERLGVG